MADPGDAPAPVPVPLLTSTSCPIRAQCAAEGKEPELLVDAPPHLQGKASRSMRGTKRHAPLPGLAGPLDVAEGAPTDPSLPQVHVGLPSSHPGSPESQ